MQNPDELTDYERSQLGVVYHAYIAAKEAKDYATSDKLRAELEDWGAMGDYTKWHPVFESPAHRRKRLEARL